ncbi:MAG TPA: choice-of-anchor J domain-containing protein, partial [candidate division Zixibacteria bacterium]
MKRINHKMFFGILVTALVLVAMMAPAKAATWDSTLVYWNTTGILYDLAVGDKLKGASDDTVRIFASRSSTPYEVMLFTDISSALPLSWRTDVVFNETGATRGKAIGDVDRDGDNDLVYVRTATPYQVRRVYWNGSAWVMDTLATLTASSANYDIAIGDADNDGYADDIIAGNSYHVFRIRWNGATWDTTRIFNGTSTTGTAYGLAIGDFDAAYAGNEIALSTYGQKVFRIRWTGAAWDSLTLYTHPSDFDFYDCAVGDFDASNPGDEIAINNGYPAASAGVYELYGSGTSWTFQALYVPGSGWSSSGEIAVGDFFTTNPGAEIVAVGGGTSPYRTSLVYGSGATWYNEQIMTAGGSAYGVAIGNVNRHRPGNEIATSAYYKIWEAEQKLLTYDMSAISIDDVPGMAETDEIITIKATVRNGAEYTANAPIPVKMRIEGPLGYVYTDVDQATSLNLAPGGTEQIIFTPDWIVPDTLCSYTIKVWTEFPGDEVPANDTVTKVVTVIRVGGIVESFTGTTFPPNGWTMYNYGATPGDAWSRYTVYYHTTPACARIYYDAPNVDWLITPRLKAVDGDKLKFWWRTQSTSYQESLWVRVSTSADVSDTGAYTIIDIVTSIGDISWREQVTDLSAYAGQNIYIAFWYRCSNYYGVAIDDVSGPYFPPQIQTSPDSIYA